MRALKWILWLIGGLLLLVVIAIVGIILFFDPNDYRDRIIAAVEDETGRTLSLEGPIEWSLFPWLSIAAGPIALSEDPAFGSGSFLTAREVAAELRLLPLLSKRVEVGTVRLEEPQVFLKIGSDGRGNWESLVQEPPPATEAGEEKVGVELSVHNIRLSDGLIEYDDRQSDTRLQLSNLDLKAAPLVADRPMEVSLSSDYRVESATGRLETRAIVSGLLDDAGPRLTLQDLTLTNTAEPQLTLALDREATLDVAAGRMEVPGFEFRSHQARGNGSLTGSDLTGNPRLEGRAALSSFNLGDWLDTTGLYSEATTDPVALDSFEATLSWSLSDGVFAVSSFQAKLDESAIEGTARMADAIEFDIVIDRLNVDRYLPPESQGGPEAAEPAATELDFGEMRGRIRFQEMVLAGLTASEVRLSLESDENGIRLSPIEGQLYGGNLTSTIDLATRGQVGLTAGARVAGVQAGELFSAWMDPAPLSGLGSLSADLSVTDPFAANPIAGLNGSLQLDLRDGAVYGFNVMRLIRQAMIATGRGSREELSEDAAETDFASLSLDAEIREGVLETREFRMASPYLRVRGGGRVDLVAGTVDYRLVPTLVSTPEGQGGIGLQELEGTPIPLSVTGPLADPSVKLDLKGALMATQGDKLKKKLREKLDLAPSSEQDAKKEQSSSDVLKGLLLDALEKETKEDEKEDDGDSL